MKYRALHNNKLEFEEKMKERYGPIVKKIETSENKIINKNGAKTNQTLSDEHYDDSNINISKIIPCKKNEKDSPDDLLVNNSSDDETNKTSQQKAQEIAQVDSGDKENDENEYQSIDDSGDSNDSDTTIFDKFNASTHYLSTDEMISRYQDILMSTKADTVYGPRRKRFDKGLELGRSVMVFSKSLNCIFIENTQFPLKAGLLDLIFCKIPQKYDTNDLKLYKMILELTCVHRKNFQIDGDLRKSSSYKYKHIIQPLFNEGGSLPKDLMKLESFKNSEYVYWDNPNELVDRLRLLYASNSAGHTGHRNEIISILEELREADIID